MNDYEYRIKRANEQWQRISFDAVLEILEQRYPHTAFDKLQRIDQGDTIETPTMEIRRYERATAPMASRPELQTEPDGDILWA